jgi:hypothetical protein
VTFRDRLVATVHAVRPILEVPDVLIVGSEVPNLIEPDAASTLVVSLDLDIGVPVARHSEVKSRLDRLEEFRPSPEEPSVWVPKRPELLEVNFLGIDPRRSPADAYVWEDDRLPLLVFGALSLVRPGRTVDVDGTAVRVPAVAGLLLEKLLTDRTGEKGERDLLVAAGLLAQVHAEDLDEAEQIYRRLDPEQRHVVRSNLTVLSLLDPRPGMPDPLARRADVTSLLGRFENLEPGR